MKLSNLLFFCFLFNFSIFFSQDEQYIKIQEKFVELYLRSDTLVYQFLYNKINSNLESGEKATVYCYYGMFLKDHAKIEESIQYLNESIALVDQSPPSNFLNKIKNIANFHISLIYFDSNQFDSCKRYISRIDLGKLGQTSLSYIYNMKGYLSFRDANYEEAIDFYDKSIEILKEVNPCELPLTYVKKMELYSFIGDTANLFNQYRMTIQNTDSCNTLNYKTYVHNMMSRLFEDKGFFKEALEEKKKEKLYGDTLNMNNNLMRLEKLNKKYDLQFSDNIIAQQKEKERFLYGIGSVIFVILIGITFLLVLNRKKSKMLEQRNLEKELLLKEIHHRVKNNFQLVSSLLDLDSCERRETNVKKITESKNRIKVMALIHQNLYQSDRFSSVNFKEFAEKLFHELSYLVSDYYSIDLRLNINKTIKFDIDTIVPLGLILNELYTNSLKYAFFKDKKNKVGLTLEKKNKEAFLLIYSDSGNGLPDDIDLMKTKTLGLRLIRRLAKQLHGSFTHKYEDNISYFIVEFKDQDQRRRVL